MTQTTKTTIDPLIRKLQEIEQRWRTLQDSLGDPAILANPQRLVAITREAGKLDPVVLRFREYKKAQTAVDELREMAAGADREMAELAQTEVAEAQEKAN